MKKFSLAILFLSVLLSISALAINPRIHVNGKEVITDQPAVIEDGRTLVPLRGVFESLGATVEWKNKTRTAIAKKASTSVSVKINSDIMTVNGKNITLDVPAKIIGGRTMVPVRAISEALGCKVDWDKGSKTVIICELYEASQRDFDILSGYSGYISSILNEIYTDYPLQNFSYTPEESTAQKKASDLILSKNNPGIVATIFGAEHAEFIYGENKDFYRFSSEQADWVKENVFNVIDPHKTYNSTEFYNNDGNYYVEATIDAWLFYPVLKKYSKNSDNTYTVEFEVFSASIGSSGKKLEGMFNAIIGLKEIDKTKVWTFYDFSFKRS